MRTETNTELVPTEQAKEYAPPAKRMKAAEMPVLRRTAEELAAEQEACEVILQQILGTNSLLLPNDLRKDPKAALTLIHYARDSGIHYQEVLQNAFCVNNKISFNTKFLITQLRRRFSVQPFYTWSGSGEDRTCTVRFFDLTRVDQNGDPVVLKGIEYSMTMKQGIASGFNGDPWKKQPEKMLMYRTAKIAIDTHWPGILGFDSGEREEYIEWANATNHTPTEGVRAVKIMGPPAPVDPKLEKLLGPPDGDVADTTKESASVAIEPTLIPKPETMVKAEPKESLFEDGFVFDAAYFHSQLPKCKTAEEAKQISKEAMQFIESGEIPEDEGRELGTAIRKRIAELKER